MNIFYLSASPRLAAKYHCNKHVVKMILETCQMLYTVHWILTNGESLKNCPYVPYKKTHYNHPCNVWLRESLNNYIWTTKLGLYLCKEYTKRYSKIHKCEKYIKWLYNHPPHYDKIEFTKPALAMPDKYKTNNVVKSYRDYYRGDKANFAVWPDNEKPYWFNIKN